MAVFFDTSTSADDTMEAISAVRSLAGKQCFVSGMSALVTDLKELCEREEPIYIGIAVLLSCAVMMLFMDSFLLPILFLLSIGMAIRMESRQQLFPGGNLLYHQGAGLGFAAGGHDGLFHLPVAQLFGTKRAVRRRQEPGHGPRDLQHHFLGSRQLHHHGSGLHRPVLHDLHPRTGSGHRDGQGRYSRRHRLRDRSAGPASALRQGDRKDPASLSHSPYG